MCSLIIAAPDADAWSLAKDLLPLLSYSAPFAIYHQYLQVIWFKFLRFVQLKTWLCILFYFRWQYYYWIFFLVLLNRLSLVVEYLLNCLWNSNAATCNMHAQFTTGENGNWFANFRTLATWISGLLATFVIILENICLFSAGWFCLAVDVLVWSSGFGICGENRNGSFRTI